MPCSSRACRLENELTDGSLGTIFHFSGLPLWQHRASLTWARRGDLICTHHLLQLVFGAGLNSPSRLGRGLWPLVGHLGECTGRDRKNKDRGAPHTECEEL